MQFKEYVLSFYGPGEIYGDVFDHNLREEEVTRAILQRLDNKEVPFDADSVDRELVRDIMLKNRDQ